MLGKTFKGMTDAMLEWQTGRLLELATEREGHVVHVRPELVVEIAFDGVQRSPGIRVESRCGSPASRAIASTSRLRTPIRSTSSAPSTKARAEDRSATGQGCHVRRGRLT